MHRATGEGKAHRPHYSSGEQRRRRRVLRHGGVGQAEIALALPQQRDLRFEQDARPCDQAAAQGELIVVGEVAPEPDPAPHDGFGGIGGAIREIGDLRVKRGPAEARDPALRADREAVGGWLLVARLASVDLDVVEEQRAEQLGALDTRCDVEPDETIRLGAWAYPGRQPGGEMFGNQGPGWAFAAGTVVP